MKDELELLRKTSQFCQEVDIKLDAIYDKKFPKKCNSCDRVYSTREEYLESTERLKNSSTVYNPQSRKNNCIQEYRNCECGSTLLLASEDRRENSEFGLLRRDLFNLCVKKFCEASEGNEESIKKIIRKVFRNIIKTS